MGSHNRFAESWDGLVGEHTTPTRFRDLHEIAYEDFRQKVTAQDPVFVEEITRSLYQGDGFLIRGAFSKEFIEKLKVATQLLMTSHDCRLAKSVLLTAVVRADFRPDREPAEPARAWSRVALQSQLPGR